jgi:hypothetical protein
LHAQSPPVNEAMTFQFLCPQGHLLQGEESHMGMQCQCPECGTAFIIPTVERPAASDPSATAGLAAAEPDPSAGGEYVDAGGSVFEEGEMPRQMNFENSDVDELKAAAEAETLLHIPCPNGHELETPIGMLDQRAKCPHCGVEFRLRREKSIEYIHQQELLDRRRAQFWFQVAIAAAAIVGLALVVMIAMMIFS